MKEQLKPASNSVGTPRRGVRAYRDMPDILLTAKRRGGSRQIRTPDRRNRAPAQRLLESTYLGPEKRKSLEHLIETKKNFEMKAEIEERLEELWTECDRRTQANAEEGEEPCQSDLAPEGRAPLRSVQSSGADQQTTNQAAMVSL